MPLGTLGAGGERFSQSLAGLCCGSLCVTILVTIGVLFVLTLRAMATHLCIAVTGPKRGTFETTFRVLCYVEGAWCWMMAIPFVSFVYPLVNIAYSAVAIKYAHDIPWWRAILVVLLSFVVIAAAILAMFFALIAYVATVRPDA